MTTDSEGKEVEKRVEVITVIFFFSFPEMSHNQLGILLIQEPKQERNLSHDAIGCNVVSSFPKYYEIELTSRRLSGSKFISLFSLPVLTPTCVYVCMGV